MFLFLYENTICIAFSDVLDLAEATFYPKNTKGNTLKVVLMMWHESILLVCQNVDSYVLISKVKNQVVHFFSNLAHLRHKSIIVTVGFVKSIFSCSPKSLSQFQPKQS